MSISDRLFGLFRGRPAPVTFAVDPVTLAAAQRIERGGHCSCLESRTKKGTPGVPKLHGEEQDSSAPGWYGLLQAIARESAAQAEVFEPSALLPPAELARVIALPPEIRTLAHVRQLRLYGSHLRRLPPELGRMARLEVLDVYTSYSLHWLPYEVTRCAQLRTSRVSTRAFYGNIKTRLPFPRLAQPIDTLVPQSCSVCDQPFGPRGPMALWTTQRIGTDTVPLLVHSCSKACTDAIPNAPRGYYARPHRGGGGVGMPDPELD